MSENISTNLALAEDFFLDIKEDFIQLSSENNFKKELAFAMQWFGKNDYLWGCTPESKLEAILNVSLTGLTLNPISKLAYLVPMMVNKKRVCVLFPSYMGICKLVTDGGAVRAIYAHNVYEGDDYYCSLGTTPEIKHIPKVKEDATEPNGKFLRTYAVAVLNDGTTMVEVMEKDELDYVRGTSESYKAYKKDTWKSSPWVTWRGEMRKKTVIKRLCKFLPKSGNQDGLYKAIALDDQDYQSTDDQVNMINHLLKMATIPEKEKESLYYEMNLMTRDRASAVIEYLIPQQMDPITAGNNFSAGDIVKKVDELTNED